MSSSGVMDVKAGQIACCLWPVRKQVLRNGQVGAHVCVDVPVWPHVKSESFLGSASGVTTLVTSDTAVSRSVGLTWPPHHHHLRLTTGEDQTAGDTTVTQYRICWHSTDC